MRSGEPAIRKKIEIQNLSDSPRLLMDVYVEDFALDGTTTDGGQGDPVFIDDEAFIAIEHPAGVNQGLAPASGCSIFRERCLRRGKG